MKPTPSPELAAAARLVLGASVDETDSEKRARFLRTLADHQFVPPAESLEAAIVLGIIAPMAAEFPNLQRRVEAEVAREVEAFADAYWTLPPEARSAEWNRLAARAKPFPRVNARLILLEAGLSFEPGSIQDDENRLHSQILAEIVENYPRRPVARAARRQEIDLWKTDDLRKTAKRIKKAVPELSRIDHGWLEDLAMTNPARSPRRKFLKPPIFKSKIATGQKSWWERYSWAIILVAIGTVGRFGINTTSSSNRDKSVPTSSKSNVRTTTNDLMKGIEAILKQNDPLRFSKLTPAQCTIVARVIEARDLTTEQISEAAAEFVRVKEAAKLSKVLKIMFLDGDNRELPLPGANDAKEFVSRFSGFRTEHIGVIVRLASEDEISLAEVVACFDRLRHPRWENPLERTAPPTPPKS